MSVGFDACGIARADFLKEDAAYLQQWLVEGRNGNMTYLERNFEKRTDPRLLVPGCKSIVVVLLNYYPGDLQQISSPKIAKYAYSEIDYHLVIKEKLQKLERLICAEFGDDAVTPQFQHSFVDSAPVLERRWAQRAGLGWIGKHGQLISPGLGSYCFIGSLMVNFETAYDEPVKPRCGGCTLCMKACPTQAIDNGQIDARRCISYLTIENKEEVPVAFRTKLSGCAIGCDICADACPWNKKWALVHQHNELKPYVDQCGTTFLHWPVERWTSLSKDEFSVVFRRSAIKRAGFEKLRNNIDVIIGRFDED